MSLFLADWDLARVALSCHIALDSLCQEMHESCCHSKESLSFAVDGLENKEKEGV